MAKTLVGAPGGVFAGTMEPVLPAKLVGELFAVAVVSAPVRFNESRPSVGSVA